MENDTSQFVYLNFDELAERRKRCTDCCSGNKSKSFHCPLCPTTGFKPAKECKLFSHLRVHWKTRILTPNGKWNMVINYIKFEIRKPCLTEALGKGFPGDHGDGVPHCRILN